MLNILDHISLRSTQKAIFFSVVPLLLLLSARDGAGKGRVEGIVLACSRRSDSGERCEAKRSAKKPLSSVPLYFSSLSSLRTALHYLNAWNRLGLCRNSRKILDCLTFCFCKTLPGCRAYSPGGALPFISFWGMCRPIGSGFCAVLVWKQVYTLPILVWNRVWFLRELRDCMNVLIVSIPNE